jgi:hypothetical protein
MMDREEIRNKADLQKGFFPPLAETGLWTIRMHEPAA